MRALLQRVREASVTVEGQVTGRVGPGLLVFLGVGQGDTEADLEWMAQKIIALRIFPNTAGSIPASKDAPGKMNLSLLDTSRALLLVSQFTLYADTRKGKRPSFGDAAPPGQARALYQRFGQRLRDLRVTVAEGVFAADMQVALVNDGPVTLWLDSRT